MSNWLYYARITLINKKGFSVSRRWLSRMLAASSSLNSRLTRILTVSVMLGFFLALVLGVFREIDTRSSSQLHRGETWAAAVALQVQPALLFLDQHAAQETLNISSLYPEVIALWVTKPGQSQPFAYYQREGADSPVDTVSAEKTINDISKFKRSRVITVPVEIGGETVAHVYALMDMAPMWAGVLNEVLRMLMIAVAVSVVVIIFARQLLKAALQPINALALAMMRVSVEHRYSLRLNKSSNDEVGILVDGFNEMLGQIETREWELQKNALHLRELKEVAEAASRAKSDFLANMSHEIRTPLNAIIGMTYLAQMTNPNPQQAEYLEKIHYSGELLLGVINQILDYSKIESGKMEIEHRVFDLDALTTAIVSLFDSRVNEKGLKLTIDIAGDIPRKLVGDLLRLQQVLSNYVGNAIRFTEQGEVNVEAKVYSQNENELLLYFEVRDTGIGLSDEEQKQLFQAFQQADASTSRQYGGTGLGLALSKRLAELMGGEVGVISQKGQGSRFWFTARLARVETLDQAIAGKGEGARSAAVTQPGGLLGARVLLVEDNPLNQQVAIKLLEKAGLLVNVASNGQEALDWLHKEKFDCVLMDVQMPVMDGFEATRQIRSDPAISNVCIIAMTANAMQEDKSQCLAVGMNDFITKPIKPEILYAAISKWIAGAPAASVLGAQDVVVSTLPLRAKADVINPRALEQLFGSDAPGIRDEMLRVFVTSTRNDLGALEKALAIGDVTAIRFLGHKIKSGARTVGADGIADMSLWLERLEGEKALEQVGGVLQKIRTDLLVIEDSLPDGEVAD